MELVDPPPVSAGSLKDSDLFRRWIEWIDEQFSKER